jgi:hypothetical protein
MEYMELNYSKILLFKNVIIIRNIKSMGKREQEEKAKRYSKISNALKSYFFKLIYVK